MPRDGNSTGRGVVGGPAGPQPTPRRLPAAMFQMMGVFAEFERSIIQERIRAGLARARSEGKERFGVNAGTVQRISRPFADAKRRGRITAKAGRQRR